MRVCARVRVRVRVCACPRVCVCSLSLSLSLSLLLSTPPPLATAGWARGTCALGMSHLRIGHVIRHVSLAHWACLTRAFGYHHIHTQVPPHTHIEVGEW